MIIKTLFLFTVLLLILKNQKGVQCSDILSNYVNLQYTDMEMLIQICFDANYKYIVQIVKDSSNLYSSGPPNSDTSGPPNSDTSDSATSINSGINRIPNNFWDYDINYQQTGLSTSYTPGSPTSNTPGSPTSDTPGSPTSDTPGSPTSDTPGSPTSDTPDLSNVDAINDALELHLRLLRLSNNQPLNNIHYRFKRECEKPIITKWIFYTLIQNIIHGDLNVDGINQIQNATIKLMNLVELNYALYLDKGYITTNQDFTIRINCKMYLEKLCTPTKFMEEYIQSQIHLKNARHEPLDIVWNYPILEYGHIFLLVREDEFEVYKLLPDANKKMFILDIMIDVLINIFHGINIILNPREKLDPYKYSVNKINNPIINITVKMILRLYEDAAEIFQSICKIINVNRSDYAGRYVPTKRTIIREYYPFSMGIRKKLFSIDFLNDPQYQEKKSFEKVQINKAKELLEEEEIRFAEIRLNENTRRNYHERYINHIETLPIGCYADRIAELDNNNKISIFVSMIEFYPPYSADLSVEPIVLHVLKNDEVQLLLEFRAWLMTIKHYMEILQIDVSLNRDINQELKDEWIETIIIDDLEDIRRYSYLYNEE